MASLVLRLELSRKFNVVADYTHHIENTQPAPALTNIVAEATRGGNHVFFGEPHADGAIVKQYELLAQNPDMFKAASQTGSSIW